VKSIEWKSMEIHGNPWKSMEIHGNPWKSMEIYVFFELWLLEE